MSKLPNCLFLLVIWCFVSSKFSLAHKGHDHDEVDHSHDVEEIKEKNPLWIKATRVPLPKGSGFDLRWIREDKSLKMKMAAKTEGYLAVGFCSVWHGTMQNCDITLGWVDNANGSAHIYDYHAKENGLPMMDEIQNYHLVSGEQKDGITSIVFKRMLVTGDESNDNDADLGHNNVHVIYAMHPEDPQSPVEFMYHGSNGRGHTHSSVSFKDNQPHQHNLGTKLISSWIVFTQMTMLLAVLFSNF